MAVMTVYEALADPTRRRILDLLCRRPHLVGELVEDLGMSQPGVSRHLRMLREAGLVNVRQDAQRRWYELRPQPLTEIDQWLRAYRDLLEEQYTRLDDVLQRLQGENHESE